MPRPLAQEQSLAVGLKVRDPLVMTELGCGGPGHSCQCDSIFYQISLSCSSHFQIQLIAGVREPCPVRRTKSSLALAVAHSICDAVHLSMPLLCPYSLSLWFAVLPLRHLSDPWLSGCLGQRTYPCSGMEQWCQPGSSGQRVNYRTRAASGLSGHREPSNRDQAEGTEDRQTIRIWYLSVSGARVVGSGGRAQLPSWSHSGCPCPL